jgi:hypothetical protein
MTLSRERIAVSVVMPTTGDRPLERSIRSALDQEGVEVEVIVVMNGRGELSPVVDDPRVRVTHSDPNLAGNGARSHGIREATHDLVALLDDDDYWQPTKLQSQLRFVAARMDASPLAAADWIVSCAVIEHPDAGETRVVPTRDPGSIVDIAEYLARRPRLRSIGQQFQSSTLVFPRRLGIEHPFDPHLRVHQDWGWVIDCARAGAVTLCLYEPLSHRVMGSPNAITRSIKWRESLRWSTRYLSSSSRRARGDFALTIAADRAMAGRELSGWAACGWAGVRDGLPGFPAWIFYLSLLARPITQRNRPLGNA